MEVKGDEESSLVVYSTCATAFPNSFYEADFEADFGSTFTNKTQIAIYA